MLNKELKGDLMFSIFDKDGVVLEGLGSSISVQNPDLFTVDANHRLWRARLWRAMMRRRELKSEVG